MPRVTTGLERWLGEQEELPLSPGSRIGLLAHPASVDSRGRHVLELLPAVGRHRLERLFAPEHGLLGHQQDMESVGTTIERATGLPVVSLYGDTVESLRPRPEDLEDLDAVVCDLQDVGSRYYTFVYTLSLMMEAAREASLPVVVLDRPNPLGGRLLEGPTLQDGLRSFVGRYPLPVRHGMTIGELARMFNDGFGIGCELHVVEMRGWKRDMEYDATGLPWIPPSPNMPTLQTARVYPGGCLVEGTNLSEGRGTTTPFELVGAPWLDGRALAARLREERPEGVLFRPASFRPAFQKHAGSGCEGVQIIVCDPRTFRPFATYLVLLREVRRQSPSAFEWRRETYEFESDRLAIDLLLGRTDLRPLIESGAGIAAMEGTWAGELDEFSRRVSPYLLYD